MTPAEPLTMRKAVFEALVQGGDLVRLLDLVANDTPHLAAAVGALIEVYTPVSSRVGFGEGMDPDSVWFLKEATPAAMCVAANQRLAAGDLAWLNLNAWRMATALMALRDEAGLRWRLQPPKAQQAPDAMPVRVVSLPDRVTDTTVSTDKNGNVTATKTVQRDAA